MSRTLPVFHIDAFTRRRYTGNPAAVVFDADALDAAEMQLIARELNLGDTAFVMQPDAPDHDLRVRFFTPRAEAAFVGHATVAAHAALTELGRPAAARQKGKTGIVRVSACRSEGVINVGIEQPAPLMRGAPRSELLAAALSALGVQAEELDPRAPPVIAGVNSTRLMLALRDAAVLARLQPDMQRLTVLSADLGAPGYFLYTLRPALPDCDTEARMFCPAIGINEDPVSGNAHGMLGAWLWQCGLLPARVPAPALAPISVQVPAFTGAQGHHLGRPGRVAVALAVASGKLESVNIGGDAVVVLQSTLNRQE